MLVFISLVGFISIINFTYKIQLKFGNWLFINYRNSWLRKLWWSEYDIYRNYDLEQEIIKIYQSK